MNFFNILYLSGLSLIVIPVILHLWRRKTERIILLPTIKYLMRAQQSLRRNLILNDVILMFLRIIIITLLAISFSRPYLGTPLAKGTERRNSIILIDTSMSMCAKNLIDKAKEEVKRLVELIQGEIFIATFNANISEKYIGEIRGAKRFVDQVNCSFFTTDVYNSLLEGVALLDKEEEKEIYLITDLKEHGWDTKKISELLMDERIKLQIIPIESDHLKNSSISNLKIEKSTDGVRIVAEIMFPQDIKGKTEAWLSIKNVPPVKILVSPDNPAVFNIHTLNGSGYVEVEKDELLEDNRRYFYVPADENIRILVVDGAPDPRLYRSESYFLHKALEALNLQTTRKTTLAGLYSIDYSDYDIFFFLNVPPIDETSFKILLKKIHEGGGLFISAGDNIDLNWLTTSLSREIGVTFKTLQSGNFHIKDFFNDDNSVVLQEFTFTKRLLIFPEAPDFRTIIKFSDGTPLALSTTLGTGRVILFASSMDIDWTSFPLSGMFLPFVNRILKELTSGIERKVLMNLTPGRHRINIDNPDGIVNLIDPEGRKEELKISGGIVEITLDKPGLWQLKNYLLIVNPDPEESNLKPLKIEQLLRDLGERAYVAGSGEETKERRFFPLWKIFLAMAGIFVALESISSKKR